MGDYARKLRARTMGKKPQACGLTVQKQMTNREFHQKRQMFCVIDGTPHVAEVGDTRYHREWMEEIIGGRMDENVYIRSPRGFYLAPQMVWYRGPMEPVGIRDIRETLGDLAAVMSLPFDTEVYSGARTGPDDVFTGSRLVGTVLELLGD